MNTPDPLENLLRRCHRAELLPLAELMGVNHDGLGLRQLSRAISRTVKRRGVNDLENIVLRRGEPPRYEHVLEQAALRRSARPGDTLQDRELHLLEKWVESAWERMSPEQQAHVWTAMGLEDPPEDGVVEAAKAGLGVSYAYALTRAITTCELPPPVNKTVLFWLTRPKDELLLPAIAHVAQLRAALARRVTIGVVGSPSSGKDAAIAALFGIDTGNIDPVAGSTKTVQITQLPGHTALYLVNTPGLGDVVESVTEEARQVLDLIDVYLYLVNAQGGVQARELADYHACVDSGRPVLALVNKIDTLRERDRERYLADAREKLGAPEEDFLAVAFDPLPQLSETPIGVDAVRAWIREKLVAAGKEAEELDAAETAPPEEES